MQNNILMLLAGGFMWFSACQPIPDTSSDQQKPPSWIQLFNGENLEGWIAKVSGHPLGVNPGNTFRVEEGLLTVNYDQYEDFAAQYGHLIFYRAFSHYHLRAEYRFIGEQVAGGEGWAWRNSGIMVHGQDPKSMTVEQDFPISIEVQLLGGDRTGNRPTANLCTPGTHVWLGDSLHTRHCLNSSSETYRGDQWVQVEIQVYGDSLIRHIVEGDTVMTYHRPQVGGEVVHGHDPEVKTDGTALSHGFISIQSESHPIAFRKIELLDLTSQAIRTP